MLRLTREHTVAVAGTSGTGEEERARGAAVVGEGEGEKKIRRRTADSGGSLNAGARGDKAPVPRILVLAAEAQGGRALPLLRDKPRAVRSKCGCWSPWQAPARHLRERVGLNNAGGGAGGTNNEYGRADRAQMSPPLLYGFCYPPRQQTAHAPFPPFPPFPLLHSLCCLLPYLTVPWARPPLPLLPRASRVAPRQWTTSSRIW